MANGTKPVAQFLANDDDFDQIKVTHRPGSTPAAASAPAVATAQPAASVVIDDDGISFTDENINDQVRAADGLQTAKISKGEVMRFAFVPDQKIKKALCHYIAPHGTIRCLSTPEKQEVCCKKADKPAADKFCALIYRYTNVDPKTGKFLNGATAPIIEVQALRMSRSNMRDALDACEDNQSVYDLDLRYAYDTSRSFGYKISRASSKTAWRAVEEQAKALSAPYADGIKLAARLGKKLNSIELNALLSNSTNSSEPANMEKLMADLDSD
jgi:hypothetical protein